MVPPLNPSPNWLARLRSLRRPGLWRAGLGLALLGVVAYQYGRHPEWLSLFERTGDSPTRPEASTSLANLSDEELAELAEIDNLALLLNQLQPMTANTLTSEPGLGEQSASGNLLEMLGQAQPSANGDGSQPAQTLPQSPFAAYLERTRFKVSDLANLEPTVPARNTANLTPTSLLSGPQTDVPANQPALTPLQQALSQSTAGLTGSASINQNLSRENSSSPDPGASATTEPGAPTSTPGLTPPSWVVEGSLPGVNQRFIRTTPEMSPPPGTTGYTLPSALQPSNPGTLPAAALPPPAAVNFNFGTTSATPAASPGVGVTAPGATLPPPLGSPYEAPRSQPDIAPFSVPRPPGSHTGGGFIYTFSDPNGF